MGLVTELVQSSGEPPMRPYTQGASSSAQVKHVLALTVFTTIACGTGVDTEVNTPGRRSLE